MKIKQLKKILSKANPVVVKDGEIIKDIVNGFDIKISTELPIDANEISFDNVENAADTIHKAKFISNRTKTETKIRLIELCKKSNINPMQQITIRFLLS